MAYFTALGTEDGLTDFAALGDEVNLAARLAGQAAAGEMIVSQAALSAAGWPTAGVEARELTLKGISRPVAAYGLREA